MRFAAVLVLLLASSAAAAQTSPAWRIAASGGLADGAEAVAASFAIDRTVRGPVSVGVRLSGYDDSGFVDDVAPPIGGALDVFGVAGTRGRRVDARAGVGIGISVVGFNGGGAEPGCFENETGDLVCFKTTSNFGPRPYGVALAGLDVYLTRSLGLGAEVRAVLMEGYDLSSAELGLRVRL